MEIHRGTVTVLLRARRPASRKAQPIRFWSCARPLLRSVAPRKLNNLSIASLVGLMLALFLRSCRSSRDRITRRKMPDDRRHPGSRLCPDDENEEARLLSGLPQRRLRLERLPRSPLQRPFRRGRYSDPSLLITSTVPGEGKSVTAYNLAVEWPWTGRNVILSIPTSTSYHARKGQSAQQPRT